MPVGSNPGSSRSLRRDSETSGDRGAPMLSGMPSNAVFINYRRGDSGGHAGRLRDNLVTHFGPDRVFMDVGILGGEDWVTSIERALSASGVVLAIIGPTWSSLRLLDPGDRLRQELEAAMALRVEIIPVVVGGARMPDEGDLPPSLLSLLRHQAVRLADDGWEDDVRRLVRRLEQLVPAPVVPAPVVPPDQLPVGPKTIRFIRAVGCAFAVLFLLLWLAAAGFFVYEIITNPP